MADIKRVNAVRHGNDEVLVSFFNNADNLPQNEHLRAHVAGVPLLAGRFADCERDLNAAAQDKERAINDAQADFEAARRLLEERHEAAHNAYTVRATEIEKVRDGLKNEAFEIAEREIAARAK